MKGIGMPTIEIKMTQEHIDLGSRDRGLNIAGCWEGTRLGYCPIGLAIRELVADEDRHYPCLGAEREDESWRDFRDWMAIVEDNHKIVYRFQLPPRIFTWLKRWVDEKTVKPNSFTVEWPEEFMYILKR